MYKILVLGVVLSLQFGDIVGMSVFTEPDLTTTVADSEACADYDVIQVDTELGRLNIISVQQKIYINYPRNWKWPTNENNTVNEIGHGEEEKKNVRADYTIWEGGVAHKVHSREVNWSAARQICNEEGGHLATIKTKYELEAIANLMRKNSIGYAWVGYHDLFEEGIWVTVLDEPMAKMEYKPWCKHLNSPDNYNGNEHCAALYTDGLNDDNCQKLRSFICKTNIA